MKRLRMPPGRLHSLPAAPGAHPGSRPYTGDLEEEWLHPVAFLALGLFLFWTMPGVGSYYLVAYLPLLALYRITCVFRVGLTEWIVFVSVAGNLAGLMAQDTDWHCPASRKMFWLWAVQLLSFLILGLSWSQSDERNRPTGTLRRLLVTVSGTLPGGCLLYLGHHEDQQNSPGENALGMLLLALTVHLSLLGIRWGGRVSDALALRLKGRVGLFLTGLLIPPHVLFLILVLASWTTIEVKCLATLWVAIVLTPAVLLHRMAATRSWQSPHQLATYCRRRIAQRRRWKRLGQSTGQLSAERSMDERATHWFKRVPWSCWLALGALFLLLNGMPWWVTVLLTVQGALGFTVYLALRYCSAGRESRCGPGPCQLPPSETRFRKTAPNP